MNIPDGTLLALDVGEKRIGIARAHGVARIASPLRTLEHTTAVFGDIAQLVHDEQALGLIVGLPRGLQGQATAQTQYVQDFVLRLKHFVTVPVYWQDEALTSQKAERELTKRGKPYDKGDIDALAATYILEDFLQERMGVLA